jgi:hypothetical protein
MTTSANPTPAPADPAPSEYGELWRAIGRLEGTAAALLEGQRELKEGQQELRAEIQASQQELRAEFQTGQQQQGAEFQSGLQEVNRRVDRLFFAMLGIGGALLVATFASRFIGG